MIINLIYNPTIINHYQSKNGRSTFLIPLPMYIPPNIFELALWYPTYPGHSKLLNVTYKNESDNLIIFYFCFWGITLQTPASFWEVVAYWIKEVKFKENVFSHWKMKLMKMKGILIISFFSVDWGFLKCW